MRGSGPSTVDGGGHGLVASHRRSDRAQGSSASRNDSAVEPVRGSPRPMSGATIGLVVDLGVAPVPVLDLQPLREEVRDEVGEHDLPRSR